MVSYIFTVTSHRRMDQGWGSQICFLFLVTLFIFDCAGSLLLCRLLASCGKWGYSVVMVFGLLIAMVFLVTEHRL